MRLDFFAAYMFLFVSIHCIMCYRSTVNKICTSQGYAVRSALVAASVRFEFPFVLISMGIPWMFTFYHCMPCRVAHSPATINLLLHNVLRTCTVH